ncbi:MAG TPA: CoA-transferase, partial [Candidatus Dormibacteraeota bacterium]|nr:CoA-transferase [Candidatus Dormibacteraeota bacterium]
RRAVEGHTVRLLEYGEAAITHGLYAGAAGLPFIPLPPGVEASDVPGVNPDAYRTVRDPFGERMVLAVAPLRPDLAFVHALEADAAGNAVFGGAAFTDRLMALAARRVVVQVERVVPGERIAAHPAGTTIPGFLVQAVVEAPGGCHPTAAHGAYPADEDHLREYLALAREPAGAATYLRRYVTGGSEDQYRQAVAAAAVTAGAAAAEAAR